METADRGEDEVGKYHDKHAVQCQNTFRRIIRRAEDCVMKVNGAKTAMVNMSGAQLYSARGHNWMGDGEEFKSGPLMKVLGFHFGHSPTVHVHLEALCKRVRRKYWVSYHLRRAGFFGQRAR